MHRRQGSLRRDPVDQVVVVWIGLAVQADDDIPALQHAIGVAARQDGIHLHAFPHQDGGVAGQAQADRDGGGLGGIQHLVILPGLLLGGGILGGDLLGRDDLEGRVDLAGQPLPGRDRAPGK